MPISLTVISSDQLEKNNVQALGNIATMTPSLRFDYAGPQAQPTIRGAAGTLLGRNSTGGAILITTKDPSSLPSADLKVSYGSYNTQGYQL